MNILMILSKEFMVDPRVYKEAKSLVDVGHAVKIIMWNRHKTSTETSLENIEIIRINNTFFMNLLPNDTFRNYFWWRLAYKKAMELYNNGYKFNVVHCHDLDTLQTGVWLKKKLKIKLIYDAHEIFGKMIAGHVPRFIVNLAFRIEKRLIKKIDYIITVNTPLQDYFSTISDKPITIIMNCTDIIAKTYNPPNNPIFTLSYIGLLDSSRLFPELIDIIGRIDGVRFLVAGKKENLYTEVKKRSTLYKNVEFLGTINYQEVIKRTLESNVVICLFDPVDENNKVGLPNKVFESMATGRPIIVTKGMYYANVVEKINCGLSTEYNEHEIKKTIIKLRDNPQLCETLGRNGLSAAQSTYNWKQQKLNLYKVYQGFQ